MQLASKDNGDYQSVEGSVSKDRGFAHGLSSDNMTWIFLGIYLLLNTLNHLDQTSFFMLFGLYDCNP